MYNKVGIAKLSHNQILKLLRGQSVRVKHGSHHVVHLSNEQHKKLARAHKNNKALTIAFDPFQIQSHQHLRGKGFFDDLKSVGSKVADVALPIAGNLAGRYLEKKLLGSGVPSRRAPAKRGRGIVDDIKKVGTQIGNDIVNQGVPYLMDKGVPFLLDKGVPIAEKYVKSKLGLGKKTPLRLSVDGEGAKPKKRGRGRPKKHCAGMHTMGGALNPAGYGVHHKVHHKKRGRPRKHGNGIGEDILNGIQTGMKFVSPFLPLLL